MRERNHSRPCLRQNVQNRIKCRTLEKRCIFVNCFLISLPISVHLVRILHNKNHIRTGTELTPKSCHSEGGVKKKKKKEVEQNTFLPK